VTCANETIFTGYAFEHEDRDWFARTAKPLPHLWRTMERPKAISSRAWHRTEDQGPQGSCQGNSCASGVERCYYVATGGKSTQFSRHFAYLETQRIDGLFGRDVGSTIAGGVKLASDVGLPPEDLVAYPRGYTTEFKGPDGRKVAREQAIAAAAPYKVRFWVDFKKEPDPRDAILNWIAGGGALHIGMWWPVQLTGDEALMARYRGHGRGMHAVEGLGYFDNGDWDVANSHSSRFGDAGWFRIGVKAQDEMIADRQTVLWGVSHMEAPVPTRIDWIQQSIFRR
jgi:hypothetical protein